MILITGMLIGFLVAGAIVQRRALNRLLSKGPADPAWRNAFPAATEEDIREFLDIVADSFGIAKRYRSRLPPGVRLKDLYRAVEPPVFSMGIDAMELETLAVEISKRYGVELLDRWQAQSWTEGLTLGDVFAMTQSRVA